MCNNCEKEKGFHIADGLWLCGKCERELSSYEIKSIQAENLGVSISDIDYNEVRIGEDLASSNQSTTSGEDIQK